jgi:hypothetical protein
MRRTAADARGIGLASGQIVWRFPKVTRAKMAILALEVSRRVR